MNKAAKIWDFIWGTLIVGMLPLLAFVLVLFLSGLVRPEIEGGWIHKFLVSFSMVACVVVPFTTLYFVARWRQRHRLLPATLLLAEVVFGVFLAGVAFFFMVVFWGFAGLE